jgi:biotin synthase
LLVGADSIFYGDTLLTTANPSQHNDRALLAAAGVRVQEQQPMPASPVTP